MLRSLYSGVTGLQVNQKSMDVIGNNMANVNTIGFKSGRAVFQDLISQDIIGGKTPTDERGGINPRQVGLGVYLAAVDNIFAFGSIQNTQKMEDLAIQGEGFFVLRGDNELQQFFSRAGDFNFDRYGSFVNPSGYVVQGWVADPSTGQIATDTQVGDITFGPEFQTMQAKATSSMALGGILSTDSSRSELEFPKYLTYADSSASIFSIYDSQGMGLELANGEPVKVSSNATELTNMSTVANANSRPISLNDGNTLQVRVGGIPHDLVYRTGNPDVTNGEFTSVGDLVQAFELMLNAATEITLPETSVDTAANTITVPTTYAVGAKVTFNNLGGIPTGIVAGNVYSILSITPNATAGYDIEIEDPANPGNPLNFTGTGGGNFGMQLANSVTFADGKATVEAEGNFTIDGFSGDAILAEILGGLGGSYGKGVTKSSTEMIYEEEIKAGETFKNLTELAIALENVINGNIVSGGNFSVEYLDNNFGLLDGETFTTYITDGTADYAFVPGDVTPAANTIALPTAATGDRVIINPAAAGDVMPGGIIAGDVYTLTGAGSPFGLEDANGNAVDITNAGTGNFNVERAEPITMTYSATPNPDTTVTGSYAFHTIEDFREAMVNALTDSADHYGAGAIGFDITTIEDRLSFLQSTLGTSLRFAEVDSNSNYLNSVFSTLINDSVTMNDGNKTGETHTIAGQGRLIYSNDDPAYDITNFTIDKAYAGINFENNMITTDTIVSGGSSSSRQFLSEASDDTLLTDIFSQQGRDYYFSAGTQLVFDASIGGNALTGNNSIAIDESTTIDDMMNAMEEYLGWGSDFNTLDNVQLIDGSIVVYGEKGKPNNIDYMTIQAEPRSLYSIFNQDMNAEILSSAEGGQLVTNQILYDRQGNAHKINYDFKIHNEENNEWTVTIDPDNALNSMNINGATTNTIVIKFNQDGSFGYMYDPYPDPNTILPTPTLRFTPANGSGTIDDISLFLGSPGSTDGMVLANSTSTISHNEQDGYTIGRLEQTIFNPAGEIIGYYTNGQIRVIGQVALATFTNNQGLKKTGDTLFVETGNSGIASIGKPLSGNKGQIASGSLENSNVDLSQEFVSMITTQRGFQANSRVITTSDEMIQELLTLKR